VVLAPETPYPLTGGGALRTASLLHYLSRTYELDLIVFREPGAPDPARHLPPGLVRRLDVLHLSANRRDRAARALRNAVRLARRVPPLVDRFSGFEREIAEVLAGRRFELGIIEHFWCAPYVQLLSAACSRTILDLHNIESQLHERCAASEPHPAALAHRIFGKASLDLERQWLPRFSQVLAVSHEDAARARSIAPASRVAVYPNAIPLGPAPPRTDDEAIVFSGNMEYHPNRSAVRWFGSQVWPQLRGEFPNLVWRLVGKNAEGVRQLASGDPRIQVLGAVDDAVRELARSRIVVVPLLAGSGTRFKILEAWAAGLPVVSTSIGAEGLGARHGEHLLVADGVPAFTDAVRRLLACSALRSTLGLAGRLLLKKEFTWEKAWRNLDF
jgi:glycosyltransferase involved in cell wall biosynthesis